MSALLKSLVLTGAIVSGGVTQWRISTASKSPRKVAMVALMVAQRALSAYAHRFSPKTYTQHQLFACLALKTFFKTDYRGITAILTDLGDLRRTLGMRRVPHFTTLQKACRRLLLSVSAGRSSHHRRPQTAQLLRHPLPRADLRLGRARR